MIFLKTIDEIEKIRQSALMVSKTLAVVAEFIDEGITTKKLDTVAEDYIRDHGGKPSFKGYLGYPSTLCISVNEQVVHGIPGNYVLKDGDIVSIDCGVLLNGYHGDHAYSFKIGKVKDEVSKLLRITKESLYIGIEYAKVGNRIGDIGFAVQTYVQNEGYSVVRELTGHGLGKSLHEEPAVANYGKRGKGPRIENGMVLAIEPMINSGSQHVKQLSDGWTIVTVDKKPSAHFEHDVAIIAGQPIILSTFDYLEEVLKKRGMDIS